MVDLLNPDKERCNRCGDVAEGFAFIGGRRYCHGDRFSGTCYEYSSSELIGPNMSDRLREALEHFDRKKVLRDLGDVDVVVAAARRFLALTETGQRVEWCEVHGSVLTAGVFHEGTRVCQYAWYSGHAVEACVAVSRWLSDCEEE